MLKSWLLRFAIAASIAAPAQAAWHKAESAHFVVYADDSARDVQRFAEILERYHAAMKLLTGRQDAVPSPSNRVTIFAVGSPATIDRLVGQKNSQIAGFYIPRAGGSRAFVPNIRLNASGDTDFSLTVLLHEYTHHFLMATSRHEMPRWFNEGAAEFYASAKFERDGTVGIGRPAQHRAAELAYAKDVKVEELLDRTLYEKRQSKVFDAFYGRSWALYHYLFFEPTRKGQLTAYLRAIAEGKGEREAAKAFGDMAVLEKDLDRYLQRSRMNYYRLPPNLLPIGTVTVTPLSAGEGAVMPLVIRSQRGVNREEATKLVGEVRAVATRFPDDPGVQTALAEAEYDAGNDAAAIAAADKAIASDPKRVNAHVQKGFALFRRADEAPAAESAQAWKAAMQPFEALNRIENDHPLPLIYFYRSYSQRNREPSELARHALERASQLAPFDQGLAFEAALMQAREGKVALAKSNLMVLAANPHGGGLAAEARKLADEIGMLKEGTPWQGPAIPAVVELAEVGVNRGN
jgi:tetratricopeptide (TPR) repeat protein